MQIYINGDIRSVAENLSISKLIKSLGLENKRIAIELNQELIPRSRFSTQHLSNEDRIEIIHAVGGG